MIVRLTFHEDVADAIRLVALALGSGERFHQKLAFDVRQALVDQIFAVKVPTQDPGIEFWQQAADSIEVETTSGGAEVSINKVGVRLRYYGGDVYPGKNPALSGPNRGNPTKALSVPTKEVPISGGAYVRPFRAGLVAFIAKARGGETVGYLVTGRRKIATRGKNKGKEITVPVPRSEGGKLLYVLRAVTHHRPDTSFIPTDARIAEVLAESTARFLEQETGGQIGD